MIDIQIFEVEHQAGQPVLFKMIIRCSGDVTPRARGLASGQGDFDLVCTIEARSTIPENDLESSFDFFQGIFSYDQPCPCLPARAPRWSQGIPGAASLPLAVLQ